MDIRTGTPLICLAVPRAVPEQMHRGCGSVGGAHYDED
jgi:hypothetical protein